MNIPDHRPAADATRQDSIAPARSQAGQRTIYVKKLSERDRRRMLRHFLALSRNDRLLRFGMYISDESIVNYVEKINFAKDKIFGVVSAHFRLVGVGHLAFVPNDGDKIVTTKARLAEFGVSVSDSARGKGIGSKLFERGAMHCRNADIDTLYMHCLSSNKTMLRIARKAGMELDRDHGETDAYLKLQPATSASVLNEVLQEQVATLDYVLKANTRAAIKWLGSWHEQKPE